MAPTPSQVAASQNPLCIEIKVHPFLNFRASESDPYRASFQNTHGYIYGIEIVNEDETERFNLFKLMKAGLEFDPYEYFESALNQSSQTIFFLNVLKNRQEQAVKRGAIFKALAFGSRNKVVLESLSQLIEVTLDAIIGTTDLTVPHDTNLAEYRKIIEKVFCSVNEKASQMFFDRGNFLERAVSLDYNTNVAWRSSKRNDKAILSERPSADSLYQSVTVTIDHDPVLRLQT